tara:strand:- start:17 stop:457 length:441 start_codon:yes stop_codon:yes gene_type:complete
MNKNNNKIKLCKEFGIIRIIFPEIYENSFMIYSDHYLMSPNMVIIIIKSMALAIIVTKYDMLQFDYYNKMLLHEKFRRFNNTGAELVIIDEKWDTTKWNYYSLVWMPYWISHLSSLNINDVRNNNQHKENKYVDINFLEAMSWKGL